jgi:tRNA pseudouridine55 synthase
MTLQQYKDEAILLINKPLRWTSNDVVNKIKFTLRAKIGHCGTLDPLASGLLILCTGRATKRVSEIQKTEKEYTGTFILGATTPSFDLETAVDIEYDISHITEEMVHNITKSFLGESEQAAPIFSAKKKEGKRYYEIARTGEVFEAVKSKVFLKEFEVTRIALPEVDFRIVCGKGFYVRSLANDFGKSLNSGAHLSVLCRTRIGEYKLENAWKPDDFVNHIRELKAALKNNAGTPQS